MTWRGRDGKKQKKWYNLMSNRPSIEASPSSSQTLWRLMKGMSWSDEASNSLGNCHIQSAGIVEDIHIGEHKDASQLGSA